jgi:GR25 family glycosyltransferase involved in LPS biosynthesis
LLDTSQVALILEDDADVPANLSSTIPSVLETAPHGWDVLKICAWGDTREADRYDDNWYRVRGSLFEANGGILYGGTCGYMVSGASVKRVLQHLHHQPITDMDAALFSDAGNADFAINTYQHKATLIQLRADHQLSTS